MGDQIVIQDDLNLEGVRTLHVMANSPPAADAASPSETHVSETADGGRMPPRPAPLKIGGQVIPEGAVVKEWVDEVRMQHLMATWPARAAMLGDFGSYGEEKPRSMAIWRLDEGQSISEGATEAALLFFAAFEYWPSAAWVRNWPSGLTVEQAFIPISADCGMDLFAVPWAYERCVLVGGNFHLKGVADE